jgi:hypothetical protein
VGKCVRVGVWRIKKSEEIGEGKEDKGRGGREREGERE